ncbi:hypothetical protein [Halomonas ramblicola]|uniref:hypothetical protein n=1 Tax=Halomonas ramblicola TaxID=747349 RepID=UPI0025B5260A|nr:hypothetical protein [Halomonas ramblicola]MDN3521339.1 hypothetical protein [Halomonas ramblicola]
MADDSDTRYPDIEVYLARVEAQRLDAWLAEAIDAEPLAPAGKGKRRTRGRLEGREIPVLLVERAADGYASLWFDSDATPWASDRACARAAAAHLGCEVRCSLGGWQPGDDPDRFLRVLPDGSEAEIDWPDSGH